MTNILQMMPIDKNASIDYTIATKKLNMPLSRVAEGTGPMMPGNLPGDFQAKALRARC